MCVYAIQEKVAEARQALMEVTKSNTERLLIMTNLFDQKKELEHKLNARQKKMVTSVHYIYTELIRVVIVMICHTP